MLLQALVLEKDGALVEFREGQAGCAPAPELVGPEENCKHAGTMGLLEVSPHNLPICGGTRSLLTGIDMVHSMCRVVLKLLPGYQMAHTNTCRSIHIEGCIALKAGACANVHGLLQDVGCKR